MNEAKDIIIAQTPPSTQNNERSYWLRKLEKFKEQPVAWRAAELEDRFQGICIDLKDHAADQNVEIGSTDY